MFKHLSIADFDHQSQTVLDIRDPQSFAAGHIPGAQPLDNSNVQAVMASLDKTQPVVVVCYHGNSSQSAAGFLVEQGFSDVYSLDGGFEGWRLAHPDQVVAG